MESDRGARPLSVEPDLQLVAGPLAGESFRLTAQLCFEAEMFLRHLAIRDTAFLAIAGQGPREGCVLDRQLELHSGSRARDPAPSARERARGSAGSADHHEHERD